MVQQTSLKLLSRKRHRVDLNSVSILLGFVGNSITFELDTISVNVKYERGGAEFGPLLEI
jgi:hypothetical protein